MPFLTADINKHAERLFTEMETDNLYQSTVETLVVLSHIRMGAVIGELSPGEYGLLRLFPECGKEEDCSLPVSLLSKRLGVSAPAVSRLLGRLEAKGCIVRRTESCDRRNVIVSMTRTGAAKKRQAEIELKRLMSRVCEKVGREEMETFITTARKISDEIMNVIGAV